MPVARHDWFWFQSWLVASGAKFSIAIIRLVTLNNRFNAALRAVPFSNSPSLGDSGTEGEECLLLLPDLSLSFSLTRSFTLSFTSFSLLLLRSFSLSFVFGSFTFSAFSLFTFSLGLSFCSLSFSFSLFFCLLSNILREMQRKKRFTPLVYSLVDKERYLHGKA